MGFPKERRVGQAVGEKGMRHSRKSFQKGPGCRTPRPMYKEVQKRV